jgi:CRISPR/Cas system-associated exonuclease Cas4 (RecB family)
MAYKRRASVSQLQTYMKCPRKWYYQKIEKIREPQSEALIKGSFLHAVIEDFSAITPSSHSFNKNNYEVRLPEIAAEIFESVYEEPRLNNFGKMDDAFKFQFEELYVDDTDAIDMAKEDAFAMLRTYVDKFLTILTVTFNNNNNFSQAYKACVPKFREMKINLDNFTGFIDQVFEIGDAIALVDLKTSKLKSGRVPDSDFFMPLGMTCIEKDYLFQLEAYLWAYYKMTGVKASFLMLNYIKYGNEICVIADNYDIDELSERMDTLVEEFLEKTESKNIEDYPMNIHGEIQPLSGYNLENLFCTCQGAKFAGRGYCFYENLCNAQLGFSKEELEVLEAPAPDFVEIQFEGSDDIYELAGWLAKKKSILTDTLTVKVERETEKAYLINLRGEDIWLPKSQLKLRE